MKVKEIVTEASWAQAFDNVVNAAMGTTSSGKFGNKPGNQKKMLPGAIKQLGNAFFQQWVTIVNRRNDANKQQIGEPLSESDLITILNNQVEQLLHVDPTNAAIEVTIEGIANMTYDTMNKPGMNDLTHVRKYTDKLVQNALKMNTAKNQSFVLHVVHFKSDDKTLDGHYVMAAQPNLRTWTKATVSKRLVELNITYKVSQKMKSELSAAVGDQIQHRRVRRLDGQTLEIID